MTTKETQARLPESTSALLDAIRFSAALAVLLGHFTQPAFSSIWPDLTTFSIAAVGAFFVMSGFVIEYTRSRHPDLADYARARLVRLWSVVIPALVYTAVADFISWRCNPAYYAEWQKPLAENATNFIADALFLNESWAQDLSFGSDNPIWSLGYEAGYYALFGAFVYLRGLWRIAALVAIIAIKGPQLLILLPIWALGAFTCRILFYRGKYNLQRILGFAFLLLGVMVFIFARKQHTHQLQLLMEGLPGGAGHSPFLFTMTSCGLITSSFILLANDTERYWGRIVLFAKWPIQWLAQSTFSIYLYHLPTLILIQAATGYSRSAPAPKIAAFILTFLICVGLSLLTERRKSAWDPAVRRALNFTKNAPWMLLRQGQSI